MSLIHGMYNHPQVVLPGYMEHCKQVDIDFSRFKWDSPKKPPDFDLKDPETAVILRPSLSSLGETFEDGWQCVVDVHKNVNRQSDICSDPNKLMFIDGTDIRFKPWTICWMLVKLDTYLNESPRYVRTVNTRRTVLLGIEPLYVAAQHAERINAIGDEKSGRCDLWMSALRSIGFNNQQRTPYITKDGQQVRLRSSPCHLSNSRRSNPIVRA